MGYSPWVAKESDPTERLTHTHYFPACLCLVLRSCPTLLRPMDCSPQGPLSMGFLREEYWSRLPFPLPKPEIKSVSPVSLHCSRFFTCQAIGEAPLFSKGYQREWLPPEWLETTEIFFCLQSWRSEVQNEGASRVVCPLEILERFFFAPSWHLMMLSAALSIPWPLNASL